MHIRHWIVCVAVTVLFISPVLRAEQHIVEGPAMAAVLAAQDAHDQANREAVLRVLDRDDVREMAARLGVSVEDARAAVGTVTSEQAAELASSARAVEADLAGGAPVVVISVTTLLLLLILVVLIAD